MIFPRKLFKEIEEHQKTNKAIVVTGMRRVGKTTLLSYFYNKIDSDNKIFLDLEDPLNQAIFAKKSYAAIKGAFEQQGINFSKRNFIFLDEIQLVSTIPSMVKYFYDHCRTKFFLTGSASFYLKNLFSESLAGRKYLFELYPLDFEEFLWFKKVNFKLSGWEETIDEHTHLLFSPLVEEYIKWGGMPEVVLLGDSDEKQAALRDVFTSYFQKEVQALGDFRKNEVVRSLILLLARRVGQKLDVQRISQELGVARQTINEYLEFLSGTYFISLVNAIGRADVSRRKQRKVYFADTGFFSFLDSPPSGSIFENAVYLNCRSLGPTFYFQKNSQEIDFVTKIQPRKKVAFEVKETVISSDLRKLRGMAKKLGVGESFAVSLNFSRQEEAKYLFQLLSFPSRVGRFPR